MAADPIACYSVVTADVVKSRRLVNRQAEQERLLSSLALLEEEFAGGLLTRLALSNGDQIQVVLARSGTIPLFLRRLRGTVFPLRLKCGVGFGPLNTAINPDPGWMDGPAFHHARQALEGLKGDPHAMTRFIGYLQYEEALNTIYQLVDAVQSGWTARQWLTIGAYEEAGTYEAAGRTLGMSASGVYQHCVAARWKAVRAGERLTETWLTCLA